MCTLDQRGGVRTTYIHILLQRGVKRQKPDARRQTPDAHIFTWFFTRFLKLTPPKTCFYIVIYTFCESDTNKNMFLHSYLHVLWKWHKTKTCFLHSYLHAFCKKNENPNKNKRFFWDVSIVFLRLFWSFFWKIFWKYTIVGVVRELCWSSFQKSCQNWDFYFKSWKF